MRQRKASTKLTEDAMLSASELAQIYGIAANTITDKMQRHGFKRDDQKRWRHGDYLKAAAAGAEMDKRNFGKKLEDMVDGGMGDSLPAQKLRKQIQLLDIEIQTAQAKLNEMLGKVVELERHKEHCESIARLMITWWDQAAENAATKVKDATVLNELRQAGERARQEILDFA